MFPKESIVILVPWSEPEPLSVVNAAIVPSGAYLRMNMSLDDEIGNVYPDDTGVLFRPILFIVTRPVEIYCPVTYIFPDESVKILVPWSEPEPLSVVNAAIVPSGAYFNTYTS